MPSHASQAHFSIPTPQSWFRSCTSLLTGFPNPVSHLQFHLHWSCTCSSQIPSGVSPLGEGQKTVLRIRAKLPGMAYQALSPKLTLAPSTASFPATSLRCLQTFAHAGPSAKSDLPFSLHHTTPSRFIWHNSSPSSTKCWCGVSETADYEPKGSDCIRVILYLSHLAKNAALIRHLVFAG